MRLVLFIAVFVLVMAALFLCISWVIQAVWNGWLIGWTHFAPMPFWVAMVLTAILGLVTNRSEITRVIERR